MAWHGMAWLHDATIHTPGFDSYQGSSIRNPSGTVALLDAAASGGMGPVLRCWMSLQYGHTYISHVLSRPIPI